MRIYDTVGYSVVKLGSARLTRSQIIGFEVVENQIAFDVLFPQTKFIFDVDSCKIRYSGLGEPCVVITIETDDGDSTTLLGILSKRELAMLECSINTCINT